MKLKETMLLGLCVLLVLLGAELGLSAPLPAPSQCDDAPCCHPTGILFAQGRPPTWQFGYWFYERKADGSSGAPTFNAAAPLYYTGAVQCYNVQNTTTDGTPMINRYTVTVPNPLPCTMTVPIMYGYNMMYPAAATPPTGTPLAWQQRKCKLT
jgi:hypothetical protein